MAHGNDASCNMSPLVRLSRVSLTQFIQASGLDINTFNELMQYNKDLHGLANGLAYDRAGGRIEKSAQRCQRVRHARRLAFEKVSLPKPYGFGTSFL
jgi:hypothetical protein